ncbi:tyrosine-type recombinase/integrase [Deinococcus sp. QL22]|uniref:tyrosine-type recombinase/integrase n=1 Tax=Deinococcus sp. QL22 TaxID=2939437 RepID=UPI002017332C|nr:tyrosine-type recombinase/integrase [Deinococcus sp. QL22]UQN08908.1 tyrosine-type recombinase/integrase [Deinococcus sp. QL22]
MPRIRFHDIRHTSASLLIRQGISAKVVSDRLGHADVAFTLSVYTYPYEDQRRSAALSLDQLLATPPSGASSRPALEQLIAPLQGLLAQ